MRERLSIVHSTLKRVFHIAHAKKEMLSAPWFVAATLALLLVGAFTLEQGVTLRPLHTAELSFADLSPKGITGGKTLPASCESGYEHYAGECSVSGPVVNGVCGATHYTCNAGQLPPTNPTCAENDNCYGTVLSCNYSAPDASGNLANSPSNPVSYGTWWNTQCGISGTGWHQGGISSCSSGQGTGNARCTSIVVSTEGQPAETSSSWTWSCVGRNGGNTASCTEAKPKGCAYGTDADGKPLTLLSIDRAPAENGGKYWVTKFGGNYCFGNSGGPRYLIPLNSWAEFSAFWNAIPRLSGLYTIP